MTNIYLFFVTKAEVDIPNEVVLNYLRKLVTYLYESCEMSLLLWP